MPSRVKAIGLCGHIYDIHQIPLIFEAADRARDQAMQFAEVTVNAILGTRSRSSSRV